MSSTHSAGHQRPGGSPHPRIDPQATGAAPIPSHRRACLAASLAVILAGCVQTNVPDGAVYRDTSVPIASTTRFEADQMQGKWTRVAAFDPALLTPECAAIALAPTPGGMEIRSCETGGAGRYDVDPLGRLIPSRGTPLWVLWADEGFRTAVIGTPDGTLGWILERGATSPADRAAAARTLLEFNGYDTSRLQTSPPG